MAKATGSYTIMDYTDGITLLGSIESNHPRTVLYDTTTQSMNPSWASTALTLTPKITKAGSTTDLIPSLSASRWYRRIPGGTWTEIVSGSNGESIAPTTKILTINQNKMVADIWQIEYKFVATYLDPVLNVSLDYEMLATFSRVANGTSFVVARAYAPGGDQFKNGAPSNLVVKSELIRGTTPDTTSLTFTWQKSTNGTVWSTISGATTDTLSVTPSMVESFAMFRCQIKDTDATSETYNKTYTTEGVAILDVSDPYQVIVESSAGQFFKNGVGSTVLTARVFQNHSEIDVAGTDLTYVWTMTDKNGNPVTTAGAVTFPKSGKTLLVSSDMTSIKGNFFCGVD